MTPEELREIALALPEATEQPHFDSASFRVRGAIFATLPADGGVAHIFVQQPEVDEAVAEQPDAVEELWWGKKLSGVRVHLEHANPELVAELITESWRRRAPKRTVTAYDASTQA